MTTIVNGVPVTITQTVYREEAQMPQPQPQPSHRPDPFQSMFGAFGGMDEPAAPNSFFGGNNLFGGFDNMFGSRPMGPPTFM